MVNVKAIKEFYYNHNLDANNTFYDSMDLLVVTVAKKQV